jgi:hypothetical protein
MWATLFAGMKWAIVVNEKSLIEEGQPIQECLVL